MKFDVLSNISGGIDSAYCTYQWLKDNPDKKMLLHYCHILKRTCRLENKRREHKSVHNIIKWLQDKNLKNFHFIESSVNCLHAESKFNVTHVLCFMVLNLLSQSKYQCNKVTLPASKTD